MQPSLRNRIGQLFLVGFTGDTLCHGHPVISDITEENLGGVILFDRFLAEKKDTNNIVNAGQLHKLTSDLQELAATRLLIAVDQEGGRVNRFREEHGFPTTPSAAELGSSEGVQATAASARQTARMLRSAGINLNLTPVVDINIYKENPIIGRYGRSFSDNGQKVAEHATAWIEEHRMEGIQCCLKHFPGHGSSRGDSHHGFVDVTGFWCESELEPYRKLIHTGHADAVMAAHLVNKNIDPDYPATLSKATLTDLLRRQLHFKGLVISDDLQMRAITDHYGLEEACCIALNAGVDLLLIGNNLIHDPEILVKAKDAVLRAVRRGEISEARIEEAWSFVQKFKKTLKNHHAPS